MSVEVLVSRPEIAGAPAPAAPAVHMAPPAAGRPLATQYLAFRLGSEEYGVDTQFVGEIRGYTDATRIANAPAFLKGVINLRGTIIPIIDLRIKLGTSDPSYGATTVTIVMNIADRVIGVVVDAVSDVLHLSPETIKPAPRFGPDAIDVGHVIGIATLGSDDERRMLMLVDVQRWVANAAFWRS